MLQQLQPDAIELHTHPGRAADFARRLQQIERSEVDLQLLSVSCPDGPGDAMPQHLWQLHQLLQGNRWPWLWQLDGRPMSGDIGAGTAQAAVNLLQRRRGQLPPDHCSSLAAPITTAGAVWSVRDWRQRWLELPMAAARAS